MTAKRYSITRRLEVDAGHRLLKHEGKCANYHGHRYAIELTLEGTELDEVGVLVDFSAVKERFGAWLDHKVDHAMILQDEDPMVGPMDNLGVKLCVVPFAPTAEALAKWFYSAAQDVLGLVPADVVRVRVYETPNCWADWPSAVTP